MSDNSGKLLVGTVADDTLTAVLNDNKLIYLWNSSTTKLLGSSFKSSKLHRAPSIFNLAKKKRLDATCLGECVKHWLVSGCFQCFIRDSFFFFLAMLSKQPEEIKQPEDIKPALGWAELLSYVTTWSLPPLMVPHLCHRKSEKLSKMIANLFFTGDATTTARNTLFLLKLSEGP